MFRLILIFLTFVFVFSYALPSMAQTVPTWEFFAGYSFQRSNVRQYFRSSPIIYTFRNQYANLNGWDAAVTENVNRWFGGTLDISGHYKTPRLLGTTNREQIYSILYGPRFSHRKSSVNFFTHGLMGVAHSDVHVVPAGPHASGFSFAMALGGGLDKKLGNITAIRLFQAEYFRTTILGTRPNSFRASAGVLFYLGERK